MDVDFRQEERIIIKFLVTEGVDTAEIYRRLSAVFKSDTFSRSRVFGWCAHFQRLAVVNLSVMFMLMRRVRQ